eukprot:TRINITY_DN751_c0_g1_i1.p1 TRINITY_DN751_c0_g1~~TRINITY_DN751_c0_g1_i1.p1  ORF type:complete len:889 (-),score=261.30 TRINITY_DN751_c0_g1_i1:493-3102(-)
MRVNNGDSEVDPLLFSAKAINGRPNLFLLFFFIALVINVGGVLFSVNVLVKYDYTDFAQILQGYNVFGVVLFLFSVIVGPFTIGLTLIELSRWRRIGNGLAAIITIVIGAACLASIIPAWTSMIEPQTTFVLVNTNGVHYSDQLRQFLGGWITIIYPMMAVLCFVVAAKFARRGSYLHPEPLSVQPLVPHERSTLRRNLAGIATLLLVSAVCYFFSTFLSGTWNYGVTYFMLPACGFGTGAGEGAYCSPWTWTHLVWRFGPTPPAESTWLTDPILIFKVYEDVTVYFIFVLGTALLGALAVYRPALRRLLHRRVFVAPGLHSFFFDWSQGFGVGEIFVILVVLGLFGYMFHYWAVKFTYIDTAIATMGDPYPLVQKWARVMGHMATLSMSLLVLPATRNSVWEACFGIPFERFVKYHRIMGRVCWMFTTIHMIMFQAKWLMEGILWNNVFNVRNLLITNYNPDCAEATDDSPPGPCAHLDNWTIPVVEAAWLSLTIVLIIAQVSRRYNYDLFYYTHYFTWFFLVSSLTHAWTHWYYVAAGFTLYFLDKLARTIKSCEDAHVVSLSYSAGVTRLEVSSGSLRKGFTAGQYAFVNIPSVSQFQWHPFTISSAPHTVHTVRHKTLEAGVLEYSVSTATFHIKDMGPGTWTHDLAQFARSFEARCDQRDADPEEMLAAIAISIDGPYGRPALYHDKETLLMVGGGIGVTPFHSIVADLYRQTFAEGTRLRNVHLIWVVRDPAMLALFADTWADVIRRPLVGKIRTHLHLYCTGRSLEIEGVSVEGGARSPGAVAGARPSMPNIAIVQSHTTLGRPDLAKIFSKVCAEAAERTPASTLADDVVTLACGPEAMITEASRLANNHNTDFFSEVFHF